MTCCPAIRGGLSVDGKLYAAPFYGESSMVMYRKDLMDKAGLKIPTPRPGTSSASRRKMTGPRQRHQTASASAARPAGGEHGFLTPCRTRSRPLVRREVTPQFDQPEWKDTLQFYVD